MKRTLVPVALAALLLTLALAPAGAAPRAKTVDLRNTSFAPASLTVKKGTMVRFNWVNDERHNVVKAKGPGQHFQSNPETGPGVRYKHRFNKAGRYKLLCTLHRGMKLKLEVKRRRNRG